MIDLEFLRGLIGAVDESGIDSLEISRGGTRIRISKTPPPAPVHAAASVAAAPAHLQMPPGQTGGGPHARPPGGAGGAAAPAPAAPAGPDLVEIKSPMVGTFYRSPAPEAPSYAEVGTRVAKGQTLCILEAMKLMNELQSDVAGAGREICVGDGEAGGDGQAVLPSGPRAGGP